MKRFYKQTSWQRSGDDAGYAVYLDQRELKTAAKRHLILPTEAVTHAVAEEWRAQDEDIDPASMPMTAYSFTALDVVADKVAAVQDEVARYGETDLLCYIIDEPAEISQRLTAAWQPMLDWSAKSLDAPLTTTAGLMAIDQPAESVAALRRHVVALNLFELTAVQTMTSILGSLVLSLAIVTGQITADQAFDLARLEEAFQAEQWGQDEDDAEKQAKDRAELLNATRFLQMVRV